MAFSGSRDRGARFVPCLEQLEPRAVPAATAALSVGVLTVTGSTGNDTITLRQANGRVSIDGVTATFATTQIQSLVVNSGAGNDTVSLTGLAAQSWGKATKVSSSAGDDSVKLLDARTVYFSGANQNLNVSTAGVTTLNGKTLDWFDLNVHDAALRSLLKTDFADKAVSRTEMLAVLRQTEKDGTVSTTEFADLKAVANNTSLFGTFTYVADLARNVILGNPANQHFLGQTLGNLAAGWTGAKLEKLVGKWFLGTDHPLAQYNGTTFSYTAAAGTLFGSGGPKYGDVHQGLVGDCYFVATLGETALKSPSSITSMFIVNGDGTYTVRFYNHGAPHYVTVDSQLPVYGGGYFAFANMGDRASDAGNVLWVALAEKAYVQMNEAGWLRSMSMGGGLNSYQAIAGGWFSDAASQIANRSSTNYFVGSGGISASALQNAINAGKLIGFASVSSPANPQVVGGHQYVLISYNASTQTVKLFNPWGLDNGSDKPGLIDVTLSQLAGNFSYWTAA